MIFFMISWFSNSLSFVAVLKRGNSHIEKILRLPGTSSMMKFVQAHALLQATLQTRNSSYRRSCLQNSEHRITTAVHCISASEKPAALLGRRYPCVRRGRYVNVRDNPSLSFCHRLSLLRPSRQPQRISSTSDCRSPCSGPLRVSKPTAT